MPYPHTGAFIRNSAQVLPTRHTRQLLETCMPGGIALGSGNTVANYVPLDNYLVVLEEAYS